MMPLQLWGGIECTVNRVRDAWSSQMDLSGHARQISDLELVASLGIRTLRYPILWELTAPDSPANPDWRWTDERLRRMRDLSLQPIAGLVHHGSGPKYTSLLDRSFAPGLAQFAGKVAARYPWIEHYTPVNEPLTTARFSGLYGHWYPHHRTNVSFAKALIIQVRAIVLAMQAIRGVNSRAQLVQTEDLGTTHSTPHMRYQAIFDNERRWLTTDLLSGRVTPEHPLYEFLRASGVERSELEWFLENRCPPQIMGINHYVTSDRYLDERCSYYPSENVGGNSRERYADVAAVRAVPEVRGGWHILADAWQRYQLPVALTEVHLGCTREEQLRWLNEAWLASLAARDEGADVRAVTAWSLFGAYNWDSLLTRISGSYEPGAFDVRGPSRRRTALGQLITALAANDPRRHPTAGPQGWWQRPEKLLHPNARMRRKEQECKLSRSVPPLLICGANGSLGRAFSRACVERNIHIRALTRAQLDIADAGAVASALEELRPWAIVNAAGYVRVDDAEREAHQCFEANSTGTSVLAAAAGRADIQLLTFSSDLVFDGSTRSPYLESSLTDPLNNYGHSKAAAERTALTHPRSLCVRTAAFFGSGPQGDFLIDTLAQLAQGRIVRAIDNVVVSPTYLPDLVEASLDLLIDEVAGIVHLANEGQVSWADFAKLGATALGMDARSLQPRPIEEFSLAARRPAFSALSSERVHVMPSLDDALRRYAPWATEYLRQPMQTAAG